MLTLETGHTSRARAAVWLERLLPIGLLALAVGSAPVMIFSSSGLPRLRSIDKELAGVERENAELRREIEALRAHVAALRGDPAAVERIARDELGLVRQSEVVFEFAE